MSSRFLIVKDTIHHETPWVLCERKPGWICDGVTTIAWCDTRETARKIKRALEIAK